eukprot:scaffold7366_cov254-Pinguiococcus_pyrenoidosus.AAC.12
MGAHVTIVARNKTRLEAAARRIRGAAASKTQDVEYLSIDMTEPEEVIANELHSVSGKVDILVCSAGDTCPMELEDIPASAMESIVRTNVLGLIAVVRAVLPGMKDRHSGRICLVSSMAGQASIFGYTVYSASKFALRGFAEALRQEVLPYKIGLSLAYPPDTETPMLLKENENKPEECKRISGRVSTVSADEVAKKLVKQSMRGRFNIDWGIDGWMLSNLTIGMLPQPYTELVVNIFLVPLLRIVGVAHTLWFDNIVLDENRKKATAAAAAAPKASRADQRSPRPHRRP